jgi:hypothetical protein
MRDEPRQIAAVGLSIAADLRVPGMQEGSRAAPSSVGNGVGGHGGGPLLTRP